MATSSILSNVVISNQSEAEKFVKAMDLSSSDKKISQTAKIPYITDISELKKKLSKTFKVSK